MPTAEVNSLVLNVKSESVGVAASSLAAMSLASKKAELSGVTLAKTSTVTAASVGKVAAVSGAAAASTTGLAAAQTTATATSKALTGSTTALGASIGALIAPLALVLGSFLLLKKGVAITGDLEHALAGVKAVTRATSKEMEQLEKTARGLGASTVFSAAEAADGMRFLGMAGFETNEILEAMPGLLDLAAAGQLELAAASDIASNVLSGFRLEAEETARVGDALAEAAANSNTDVRQLGEALSYAAPIAAALGIEIEATAAAIGVLSDNGIQGQRAGTGLRTTMAALSAATPEAQKALKSLGLTIGDVNPEANSLGDILRKLDDAGLDAARAFKIFGREGAPAVLAITSQVDAFDRLEEKLNNAEGAAADMAEILSDDMHGAYKKLGSVASEFALELDETIGASDLWRKAIDNITESVSGLTRAISGESKELRGLITEYDAKLASLERLEGADKKILANIQVRAFALKREIDAYSARDVALARAQNSLEDLQKQEGELGTATKRGFFETVGRFESRRVMEKDRRADVAESIAQTEEQIAQIEAEIAQTNKLASAREALTSEPAAAEIVFNKREAPPTASKDLERVAAQLQTEEEAITASYERRIEIIREHTLAGSTERANLAQRAEEAYLADIEALNRGNNEKALGLLVDSLGQERATYDSHFEEVRAQRQERFEEDQLLLAQGLDSRLLAEQEFQTLSEENWERYSEDLATITEDQAAATEKTQRVANVNILSMAGDLSAGLENLAEEGTNAQKALFVAQKGISIAQGIINTELAATRALTAGPFLGIPMATAIRAAGYASVGLIAGQTVGSFENGGIVGGNSLTGDKLTANVNSREMILNGSQQARLFDIANGRNQNTGGGVNVIVENYGSSEITVEQITESDIRIIAREQAREIVRRDAPGVVAADIGNANGVTSKSLAQNTKTERRR